MKANTASHQNSSNRITPVILCGGAGKRLWPLSRKLQPKQFCSLIDNESLFRKTIERIKDPLFTKPIIVSNKDYQFLIEKELASLNIHDYQLVLEPVSKNTAPAIALAALSSLETTQDAMMLVMPSDHLIQDHSSNFMNMVYSAQEAAENNNFVTFGVKPSRPETGYGYIHFDNKSNQTIKDVLSFVEKPDKKTAEGYIKDETYLWNSGIFMFKSSAYLKELEKFEPEIVKYAKQAYQNSKNKNPLLASEEDFDKCPNISIDYALMERTHNAKVVPLSLSWSDLGNWEAMWQVGPADKSGNVIQGKVLTKNVQNSYLRSEGRLIAAVGLSDIIIVESGDAVLVANKSAGQEVKEIVESLESSDVTYATSHLKEERPWGYFESIDRGERFQVKRITVSPGKRLSLQMHHHRAEHWVVVRGTAKVTRDEEIILLNENQSIYIPCGVKHRLENPGKIPLELIEVQSGEYLGEDDIVRFTDDYGR